MPKGILHVFFEGYDVRTNARFVGYVVFSVACCCISLIPQSR